MPTFSSFVLKEVWADALCVDERSGANHLVKAGDLPFRTEVAELGGLHVQVYRRIVSLSEEAVRAAKEGMEELDD